MLKFYTTSDLPPHQWAVILIGLSLVCAVVARRLYHLVSLRLWSSYRNLPHAPPKSLLSGSKLERIGEPWTTFFNTHGDTAISRDTSYRPIVVTRDLGFVSYLQHNIDDFEISTRLSKTLVSLGLSHGISGVRGTERRRVKRSYEIALSCSAMKEYFPDILAKAYLAAGRAAEVQGHVMMNSIITRYMAEVVRQCCFGKNSQTNEETPTEMESVIRKFQQTRASLRWWDMVLPFRTTRRRAYAQALKDITAYAWRELESKKKGLDGLEGAEEDFPKDVVSNLIKLSMVNDEKDSQRLSESEIADNIPIIALASSDVNRMAQLFTLHMLAINPKVQEKLYEALEPLGPEPTLEAFSDVPYLDAVIEEAMRFGQPYTNVERTATRDCVVPLRNPVKGQNGKVIESVAVRKGTDIEVPLYCVNMDQTLYGADADKFRPERFLDGTVSSYTKEMGFTWGKSTIFWGGGRGCPAFNYALATNKAIVLAIVRSFVLSEPEGQTLVRTHGRVVLINGKPSTEIPFICTPR